MNTADNYRSPVAAIQAKATELGAWLAIWSARGDGPDAHARRCASHAMDAVDAMIAELYGIRASLVTSIRQSDDASAARADALLAAAANQRSTSS